MSKLEELIERLCPDGVEFASLNDFFEVSNVGVDKKINPDEEMVNLLNYMDVYRKSRICKDDLTMQVSASRKKIEQCNLLKGDVFITPTSETIDDIGHSSVIIEDIPNAVYSYHVMRLRPKNSNKYSSFFMCYLFRSDFLQKQIVGNATGMTRFGLSKSKFESLKIPLPPLEIQQEIVRILDTFTMLEAELEAELEARKKQYSTYLDDLLKSKKDTPQVAIKDVVDITRGVRVTKNQISNGGSFAVYQNSLAPMGYFDKFNFNENATYIISAGAAGEVGFSKSKFWAADDCFVLRSEKGVINKFVYYCLKSKQNILFSNVRRASIPRLSRNVVEDIEIPFFDIETQKRIVNILDHFDTLVNDLSHGLPAEIAARHNQYEYYRNKLLTFKEVKHESI